VPLYEYRCPRCGTFEQVRKFADPPLGGCPTCGQPVEKLPSSPAIQFKGTGWYVTDYARKGSSGEKKEGGAAKEKAASASSDGKSPAADSKPSSSSSGSSSGSSSDAS